VTHPNGRASLVPSVHRCVPAEAGAWVGGETLNRALRDDESRMPRRTGARDAPSADLHLPIRVDVPVDRGPVYARTDDDIGDDQQVAMQREDAAAMLEGTIAIVRRIHIV